MLECDSVFFVIEVDVLCLMVVGLIKFVFVFFYFSSRCYSICVKKWIIGVIYIDVEFKLMVEIERDYSVSGK